MRRNGRVDQVTLSLRDQEPDSIRLCVDAAERRAFNALQLLKLFKCKPRRFGEGRAKEKKVYNGVFITLRQTSANLCIMTRNPGRPHGSDIALAL